MPSTTNLSVLRRLFDLELNFFSLVLRADSVLKFFRLGQAFFCIQNIVPAVSLAGKVASTLLPKFFRNILGIRLLLSLH